MASNNPIDERVRRVFPDAVDYLFVSSTHTFEYTYNNAEVETFFIQLNVIFDGVWAAMSEKTHRVYIYLEE